jgi:hypothetical protein
VRKICNWPASTDTRERKHEFVLTLRNACRYAYIQGQDACTREHVQLTQLAFYYYYCCCCCRLLLLILQLQNYYYNCCYYYCNCCYNRYYI